MNDDKSLNKLMLLKRAVDQLHSDELQEWEQDQMEGAWQILHDEPGTEREDWETRATGKVRKGKSDKYIVAQTQKSLEMPFTSIGTSLAKRVQSVPPFSSSEIPNIPTVLSTDHETAANRLFADAPHRPTATAPRPVLHPSSGSEGPGFESQRGHTDNPCNHRDCRGL